MALPLLALHCAVTTDAADIFIIWRLILLIRRADLAERLMDECIGSLRRAGVKRALILVAHDNPRGRKFWRRHGWEEVPGPIVMGIDL